MLASLVLILYVCLFEKSGHKWITRVVVLFGSVVFLTAMLVMAPERKGDGQEYVLMTESLVNHLSPDLRENDTRVLDPWVRSRDITTSKYSGYFVARDGNYYSYHFWGYPALCVPDHERCTDHCSDGRCSLIATE